MDRQIVEDHHIAGAQGGHQHLFDIGEKRVIVNRAVKHGRRLDPVESERRDHGMRLPMTAGRVIPEPRSARTPTIATEQIRRNATFIDKDVLPGIMERLPGAPLASLSGDVWPSLFVGVYRFFSGST